MSFDWTPIIVAVLGGGTAYKLVELGYLRWRESRLAKGKRESITQTWKLLAMEWEGVAHAARTIGVKHGVPVEAYADIFDAATPTVPDSD